MFCIDVQSGKTIKEKWAHKHEIFKLHITHDFTMLVTCSKDGTAKLQHPETFEEIRSFDFKKPVRGVAISPLFDDPEQQKFHLICVGGQDAKDVALTGSEEGGFEIKLYSIIFQKMLAEIHGHFGTVNTVDFSPDGLAFASGAEDGIVHYHKFPPEYFTKKFE